MCRKPLTCWNFGTCFDLHNWIVLREVPLLAPITADDMNHITRPIKQRQLLDAGPHQGMLDAYGAHLAGTGLSPVSVHIHQGSARHFLAWLVQGNTAFDQVGADIVAQFAGHACGCHSAPRPLGQYYINHVARFVRYLADLGHVPTQPETAGIAPEPLVAEWLDALATQRGLAPATNARHGRMLAHISPLIGPDPGRYTPRVIRDGVREHARMARSAHHPKMVASALRRYCLSAVATTGRPSRGTSGRC